MRKGQSSPKICRAEAPSVSGSLCRTSHLTASPFRRLQVHLPLSLSRARLPRLLRAPRPGLGLCTRAGHERGERGVGKGRAGRKAGAQRRCSGLIPTPCTVNIPITNFPALETLVLLAGLSGADSTPNLQPTNHWPRRRALAGCTRTSHTPLPALRQPRCTCAHAPARWEAGPQGRSRVEIPLR